MIRNQSREDLREDVLRSLGYPVVRVNLSTDQIDTCINYALKVFWKYHRNGSVETFRIYKVTEADVVAGSISIPQWIDAVVEVLPKGYTYGDFSFATVEWQMQKEAFLSLNRFATISAVDYTMVMQRVYNLGHVLGRDEMPFTYVRYQRRLIPRFKFEKDDILVMRVYENLDPERTDGEAVPCLDVWDDETLKGVAVAQAKQMWGNTLKKFSGIQLPGGVSLDGQSIFDEGQREEQEIMEHLLNEQPIDFMMG